MSVKRALDYPRNSLVQHFVRLVSELDASSFAFENVKDLTFGRHRAFLDELIEAFEERGYDVVRPYRVLNAANFGVPQNRERLFVLGVRKGRTLPCYPAPLTRARSEEHTSELQSLMRISYAVFCLKKKKHTTLQPTSTHIT